jgi:Protein of unknown function, DUF547
MHLLLLVALLAGSGHALFAQAGDSAPAPVSGLHRPLDTLLDLYVRDGFVYYNAVRSDRARLDGYIRAVNGPAGIDEAKGSREEQLAFWINAYNAFVLQTVINHFPIRGRAREYPSNSIRQIPGAFEKNTFRAAGRSVTLDEIEKEILAPLGEPRAFLALGRGAIGGGRLKSEAFDGGRLEKQLQDVAAEAVRRDEVIRLDVLNSQVSLSPLFSWREAVFTAAFADKAHEVFKERSALERAVLGLIQPFLLTSEAEFLEKNTFKVVFHEFDWRLNDLSNRPPDGD